MKLPMFIIPLWIIIQQRASTAPDNKGTNFILGFGENYRNDAPLELFIATDAERVTATISVPRLTGVFPNQTVDIFKGNTIRVELPTNLRMSGLGYQDTGILVQSSDEVVIYATNKASKSADAFLVLPTDVVGTLYFVPSYPNAPFSNKGPQVGVIATEINTTVTFTMPANRAVGRWYSVGSGRDRFYVGDGDSQTITLDAYQAYQLQIEHDLTGVKVESNHPVAVVSGNMRTYIMDSGSSDHLEEMIPPVNTWGRKFITVPFADRTGGDLFRIIGSRSNTTVLVTSTKTGDVSSYLLFEPGDFKELDISSDDYLYIEANGAVFMCQYSKTAAVDGADSDPMMMNVPPVEQFGNEYTFSTVEAISAPYTNYINIVIKTQYAEGLRLDEQAIPSSKFLNGSVTIGWINNWMPVANTDYSANTLFVTHGTYVLYHTSPVVPFAAFMYGQVIYESYGYPAGSRFSSIGDFCQMSNMTLNDGVDNDCDGLTDEELLNGQDDDGDGYIDEDVVYSNRLSAEASTTPTTTTTTTEIQKTTATEAPATTITTTETPKATSTQAPRTTTETPTATTTAEIPKTTAAPKTTRAEALTTTTTTTATEAHVTINTEPQPTKSTDSLAPTVKTTQVQPGTNSEVPTSNWFQYTSPMQVDNTTLQFGYFHQGNGDDSPVIVSIIVTVVVLALFTVAFFIIKRKNRYRVEDSLTKERNNTYAKYGITRYTHDIYV